MYIPYYELAQNISKILPNKYQKAIVDFGYRLKLNQNLKYIAKNQKQVLKQLSKKTKLNVAFYVYDDSKWLSQSVYDLMSQDDRFEPYIFVTKNAALENNFNYQTIDNVKKTYEFFKSKDMNVIYAYDIENDKYIPFEKMSPKPDIIIYQHPWYVETTQGPVVCSKFALTYYIPYFISDTDEWFEYDLRFHKYIYRHYVPNNIIKNNYAKKMTINSESLLTVGHPQLDNYLVDDNEYEKKYTIYAPHWTVCGNNLRYSTFDWNGQEILEFAKQNTDLNWVFKPHPNLYNFFITSGYMSKGNMDKYFAEWGKIGKVCLDGNYVSLFKQSRAMITDSGSFLNEYFVTGQPLIHLVSESFKGNESVKKICNTYYNVYSLEEMNKIFEKVLINGNDTKKQERKTLLETLNYQNSAKNIIDDISKIFDSRYK